MKQSTSQKMANVKEKLSSGMLTELGVKYNKTRLSTLTKLMEKENKSVKH